jgi:NAD(P)H-dependent FMN reductase
MNILAFAASTSRSSINKQLVQYTSTLLDNHNVEIIDLNDYELPLFSEDKEKELGHPQLAKDFFKKIGDSDAVIISYAEHNGSYSAAYKNIFDWASRIDSKVFQGKPMFLMATSPGPGGAGSVLAAATNSAPYFNGDVRGSLSVPSFYDNFDTEAGQVTNSEVDNKLKSAITLFGSSIG